jgi:hypothetical protein
MLRTIIIAALAACGVSPTQNPAAADPPVAPDDKELPDGEIIPIESHWCCQSVDPKTASGEGCTSISGTPEVINACAEYLNCSGSAAKHDGKVTCIPG